MSVTKEKVKKSFTDTVEEVLTSANGNSADSNFKQYHFLQLRVGQISQPPEIYSGEQLDLELTSYLQDDWIILNASTHFVPIPAGQPFGGWYCIYHLVK